MASIIYFLGSLCYGLWIWFYFTRETWNDESRETKIYFLISVILWPLSLLIMLGAYTGVIDRIVLKSRMQPIIEKYAFEIYEAIKINQIETHGLKLLSDELSPLLTDRLSDKNTKLSFKTNLEHKIKIIITRDNLIRIKL
jgi:hypothetical protein